MECCLCENPSHIYRSRNSICARCFEGAQEILEFVRRQEGEEISSQEQESSTLSKPVKGLADAIDHIKQLEQDLGTSSNKINFLASLGDAFHQGFHTDLELVTDDGLSCKVHKVIMATRSSVFRTMLETEDYKVSNSTKVRIPEITHVVLKHLVEFMYSGQLTMEALQYHSAGLMLAADKFDIPILLEVCEAYLIDTMDTKNALEALEIANRLSSATALKEAAMKTIMVNSETILFSEEYEDFAIKNPLLALRVSQYVMQQLNLGRFLNGQSQSS